MKPILENQSVERLVAGLPRSPMQLNGLNESDAEILRHCPDGNLLAITTDSIAEEIASGLYKDPYLIGWMTVVVNMSDLAAVGACPLGIVISEILPPDYSEDSLTLLQRGIADACKACSTFVLGGDTNTGRDLVLTGCALGKAGKNGLTKRIGARPGDGLYSTGPLGGGNGFALAEHMTRLHKTPLSIPFFPLARLQEGQSLVGIASSCMDTSDGVFATLDQLMRVNKVGFELAACRESLLHSESRLLIQSANLAPWLLLAGQHGEFELLFTVPEAREEELRVHAAINGWNPRFMGRVIKEEAIRMSLYGEITEIDTAAIRNLSAACGSDIEKYINELGAIDQTMKKGKVSHVNS